MQVASYVRVSTDEQDLERQLKSTHECALNLGAEPSDIRTYRDKRTGTNTAREEFRELLADVDAGQYDAVVTHSVSRLSRSIRDLDRTVERIVEENDTALHVISEGFEFVPGNRDPYQKAMFQMLGVFAELEAEMAQKRTQEGLRTRLDNGNITTGRRRSASRKTMVT